LYHYRIPGSRQAARDGFQVAVDLSPALHQVIVHLQAKEEPFREAAKITRQPKIGIRGNVPFAQHDLIDATRRDMHGARKCILAQIHRLEKLLEQDFARMRVAQQGVPSRGSQRFRHALVLPRAKQNRCATGLDPNRVLPLPIRLQRFEPISGRNTKIVEDPGLIQKLKFS
jgi:hypothetical protein